MPELLDYYHAQGLSTAFYDLVSQADPTLVGEVDYYAGLIPQGSWVLELGCGTGRITLPLAERNYAVLGLDIAKPMLDRAEIKRARLAPEVVARTGFIHGDMTSFALDHRFDAVIAPFFGFSHLRRGAPRRKAFETIARHLAPGGVAALHTAGADTFRQPRSIRPNEMMLEGVYDDEGRRLRVEMVTHGFDEGESRYEQVLDYVVLSPGGEEERRSRERLDYYLSNLESDARGSGLVLKEKISPFNTVGEMWVFRRN